MVKAYALYWYKRSLAEAIYQWDMFCWRVKWHQW